MLGIAYDPKGLNLCTCDLTDCAKCSKNYATNVGGLCTPCADSTGELVRSVFIVVVVVVIVVATILYLVSGEMEVAGRGIVDRVVRYLPHQTLKIVIVVWQILTQVRGGDNETTVVTSRSALW